MGVGGGKSTEGTQLGGRRKGGMGEVGRKGEAEGGRWKGKGEGEMGEGGKGKGEALGRAENRIHSLGVSLSPKSRKLPSNGPKAALMLL